MKKAFIFFSALLNLLFSYAQISISEVLYDTPIIEKEEITPFAHAGEFVELFNYSNKAIDISGWILSDNYTTMTFPDNTIIEPGQFLIYRKSIDSDNPSPVSSNDYFFQMFDEINIPQDVDRKVLNTQYGFLLNNYNDKVALKTNKINGKKLNQFYEISRVTWNYGDIQTSANEPFQMNEFDNNSVVRDGNHTIIGINYDFDFYVNSFQRDQQNMTTKIITINSESQFRRASPLALDFEFDLINLDDIESYNEILYNNYCQVVDWQGSVNNALNTGCNPSVSLINEIIYDDEIITSKCFNYDAAGNQTTSFDCAQNGENNPPSPLPTEPEEDYSNHFYIAPNPTYNTTTLSWDIEVDDLIASIIIVPVNGAYEIPVNVNNASSNSIVVNLSTHPAGLYVVRFQLTNGSYVNKYIMKL